jgi:hypothetical protein
MHVKKNSTSVDLFFTPLLHLTYMQGLTVLLHQSIKTRDIQASETYALTQGGR